MPEETIINLIPWAQLGFSAIFLIFILVLWKKIEEKDKKIDARDEKQAVMTQQMIEVVKENTKATQAQTEVSRTLSQQVYDVLTKKG